MNNLEKSFANKGFVQCMMISQKKANERAIKRLKKSLKELDYEYMIGYYEGQIESAKTQNRDIKSTIKYEMGVI